MFRLRLLLLTCILSCCLSGFGQSRDSLRQYVWACIDTMEHQSVYSERVNWKKFRRSVAKQMKTIRHTADAEAIVIRAFQQLGDQHGMYGGIDTSFRYQQAGAERKLSPKLLEEYKKPRAPRTAMLNGQIGYYKMPAVLIGSDTSKMRIWPNLLTDSLCALMSQTPRALIVDLRMNNGGNFEPMWQTLKNLIGPQYQTYTTDAHGNRIPDDSSEAFRQYQATAIPSRPCQLDPTIKVAVLIGPGTASSGEILAQSFHARPHTRLFGEESVGVANVTNGFIIQNRGYLLLTVGYITDATGRPLKESIIKPDQYIAANDNYLNLMADPTVQAAWQWLQ